MISFSRKLIFLLFVLGVVLPLVSRAQYEGIDGAFIVAPSKQEIKLSAGESIIRNIYVTNKLDRDSDFSITVEDVSGSVDAEEVVKYYGQSLGPYSLRKYVMIANDRVHIEAGETKVVPVMISLPAEAKPGGLYGGVFISAIGETRSGANVSTRAGSLIFLRIKGDLVERGELKNFEPAGGSIFWRRRPIDFNVTFANIGNIYLNPYGLIEIARSDGQVIDRLPIEPWFVFPDATRNRSMEWKNVPRFGIYTATLYLNYGYTDPHATISKKKIIIVPLPFILVSVLVILVAVVAYKLIRKAKKWQI